MIQQNHQHRVRRDRKDLQYLLDLEQLARQDHIKREGWETVSIELEQNPDIAAEVGRRKRPGQVLIGFAAETDDLLKNARAKMERKGLDLIVANDVLAPGCGFGADTNTVRVLSRDEETVLSGSKEEVADGVWDLVAGRGLF